MRHVIIGNSAAGVTAAENLRALQPHAEIVVISDESEHAYSRCLLPDFLSGERSREKLRIRDSKFYERNRIDANLGKRVEAVDAQGQNVILADGQSVPYDKLLVATGASSFTPPIPGLEYVDAFGLRTLDDAEKILTAAESARSVVVVGGGFVGLEAAYGLRQRGMDVTVVEMVPQILALQFDEMASEILADDLRAAGIKLVTGVGVKEVESPSLWQRLRGTGKQIVLASGEKLAADLIVLAVGTRTNVAPVKGTGMEINRGILVNEYLQTSIPDIFAAGDVAETRDVVTGSVGLSPIWPNAVIQGRYAAHNMAGLNKSFNGLVGLQNAVEFREVPAIAMGLSKATEEEGYEILRTTYLKQQLYQKLVLKDNKLQGMILVGDIRRAGVLGALIRTQTDVTKYKHKLLNPSFSYADILTQSA